MAKTKVHGEYLDPSVISAQTEVTAVGSDHMLIFDATDNALKKALLSDLIETVGSTPTFTSLTVDDITINDSTISDSGDLTLDVGGDIILDADGGDIKIKDGGTDVGIISVVNSDRMVFATADGLGLQFDKDNNRIIPCDAAGAYNNNVELGDSSLEFTNLWLSNNAYIGNAVGIGTTSPGRTLDVNGIIRSDGTSGALAFGGNSSTPSEGVAIHRPASDTMAFVTASTERMRIDSSGNVGIGLPSGSPDARLTVSGSANSEQVIITGNGNQSRGLSILTAATGGQQDAKVIFNAQDTENVAYPAMQFETGGQERIRMHHVSTIFSTRVGLNHPSELMFNGEYTAGQQDVAVEAGHAARIEFLKDDFLRFQGSASVAAGAIVSYADKLKINIDSGGILFGADTAAANTLDDYEEGTWTPAVTFGSQNAGQVYSLQQGKYVKIGSMVYIQGHLYFSNKGTSTGNATLTGLPFALSSVNAGSFTPIGDRGHLNTSGRPANIYLHSGGTTALFYSGGFNGTANTNVNNNAFANNTEIDVNFCYYTDA